MKGIAMLSAEQKKWILSHKDHPEARKILEQPMIKSLLITPLMEDITSLLGLGKREQLKLIAFDDNVLKYAYDSARHALTAGSNIRDKFAWFITICQTTCDKNSIRPDWNWYFAICKIVGIDAIQQSQPVIEQPKVERKGVNAIWQKDERRRFGKPLVKVDQSSPEAQLWAKMFPFKESS